MWNHASTAVRLMLTAIIVLSGRSHGVADDYRAVGRSSAGKVLVTLRSMVAVDAGVVHLTDIAMVSGGDAMLREDIKLLDVEEAVEPGETLEITSTQIEFRLQLAGIGRDEFNVRGVATRVTARTGVRRASATSPNFSAFPSVATTRRSLGFEADEMSRWSTKSDIGRNTLTSGSDLRTRTGLRPDAGPILVKRNETVRLSAKSGALNVITFGEAQQDGRVGEVIRVLNARTRASVMGRVTAANEVEVTY